MALVLELQPTENPATARQTTEDRSKPAKRAARKPAPRLLGFLALGGAVSAAALGAGLHWTLVGSRHVSTENAYVGASSAHMSSQVVGVIAAVPVEATQFVSAGDELVLIDPRDARLALAEAEAAYARTLQQVRQYHAQVEMAVAQVRAAEAALERATSEFERRSSLAETGAISAEELTTATSAYDAAQANLASANNSLLAAQALTQGVGIEDHPEALAAAAAVDTARLNLERTAVRAPVDGVVGQVQAQIGQRVAPGTPLLTVTPIQEAYVDANFKEGQLRDVRVGQEAELVSDLYGHDVVYHGRVAGIGAGSGAAFSVIPAQNATGNWIKVVQRVPVRIELDPAQLAEHPLRVGLSMHATIDVSEH
jgi:membrane fusion protein (multidrug efflux system)